MTIDRLDADILESFTVGPRIGVLEGSRRSRVARGTVQARPDRMRDTGAADLMVRVVARSNADLQRVIDDVVPDPAVLRTATVIALDTPWPGTGPGCGPRRASDDGRIAHPHIALIPTSPARSARAR